MLVFVIYITCSTASYIDCHHNQKISYQARQIVHFFGHELNACLYDIQ